MASATQADPNAANGSELARPGVGMVNGQGRPHRPDRDVWDEDGRLDIDFIKETTDHQLPEQTYYYLRVWMTQDLVLSNLKDAEVTEIKYLARVEAKRILIAHPFEECVLTGEYREAVYGTENDSLVPLRWYQEAWITQLATIVFVRTARSRGGFQWDKFNESVQVSRDDTKREKVKSRLWSLFS